MSISISALINNQPTTINPPPSTHQTKQTQIKSESAVLKITAGTLIQAEETSETALMNFGSILLAGYTIAVNNAKNGGGGSSSSSSSSSNNNIDDDYRSGADITIVEENSIYSSLTVRGQFLQSPQGSISITVANTGANYTMMHLTRFIHTPSFSSNYLRTTKSKSTFY